jgi:hypothetical protein
LRPTDAADQRLALLASREFSRAGVGSRRWGSRFRGRPGAERVVTSVELFFDLVYVFAIGQLSHHLLEHVDLRTGAET